MNQDAMSYLFIYFLSSTFLKLPAFIFLETFFIKKRVLLSSFEKL